jgi:RNA polymerase sigma-70 factor (ECF subfamily)
MDINEIELELKKHDYSHFDEFYELTNKTIYFTSLAILKEHTLAEDILQDTYLSFFANINDVKLSNNIYAYLSTIARNLSINLINKQKSILTNDEILVSTPDVERNNDRDIDNILNLLDSQEEREIVKLHVILDYKFIEISRIVDKPLGTVLWIYNKAIKKLKERIGDIL